jgi:hypothetical protein
MGVGARGRPWVEGWTPQFKMNMGSQGRMGPSEIIVYACLHVDCTGMHDFIN